MRHHAATDAGCRPARKLSPCKESPGRMSELVHIIIGAGQAGGHAAIAMREAGFGGRILLIGDEPHRPYERPPLSKEMLIAAEPPPPLWFHSEQRYAERAIETRLGSPVAAIDTVAQRVLLRNGARLAYDRLLLATGGRARRLAIPGGERMLLLRTLEDARALRARLRPGLRVACIGAGVIGLEIAAAATQRGCAVEVNEAGPVPMGRSLTPDFAAWIAALHRAAGVRLHFNATVQGIEPDRVICADGLVVEADLVVAGVGMQRNTALAEAAGLAVDGGIVVDEFGRSSVANIYAAGDVAAFWHPRYGRRLRLESWRHAQNHGIATGRAMAGVMEPYDEIPWFWSDQHGANLQMAGLLDGASTDVWRGATTGRSFAAFHLDAAGRVLAATGVNAMREIRAAQAMIRAGRPVDAAALADPAGNLQKLAKG
jgi:NADPH-dependent 2,4-dienoyl-CoA reductase/sulfur reductase-like enzyme